MVFGWLGRAASAVVNGTANAVISGINAIGNVTGSLIDSVRDGFEDMTHRGEIHENNRQAQIANARADHYQQRTRMTESHGRTMREINDAHENDVNQEAERIRDRTQAAIDSAQNFTVQMFEVTAYFVTSMVNAQTNALLSYRTNSAIEN